MHCAPGTAYHPHRRNFPGQHDGIATGTCCRSRQAGTAPWSVRRDCAVGLHGHLVDGHLLQQSELPWTVRWNCDKERNHSPIRSLICVGTSLVSTVELRLVAPGVIGDAVFLSELPWSVRWDCDFLSMRSSAEHEENESKLPWPAQVGLRQPLLSASGNALPNGRNFPGQYGGIATSARRCCPRPSRSGWSEERAPGGRRHADPGFNRFQPGFQRSNL